MRPLQSLERKYEIVATREFQGLENPVTLRSVIVFFGCNVKDAVYVPPLPKVLDELKCRVTDVVNVSTTDDILQRVVFDYSLDVRRASKVRGHMKSNVIH